MKVASIPAIAGKIVFVVTKTHLASEFRNRKITLYLLKTYCKNKDYL